MFHSLRKVSDSDIRLLGVFHKVVACEGLSAAELELNIGRSTISRHLKDLEIRLGVKLCHRGRSKFSLTPEGREVYEASLTLFDSLESFKNVVNDIQENLKGTLNIGVFDKVVGNPGSKIPQAIEDFYEKYPEIKLEIHVDPLNDIENKVMRGEYQLGVVPIHRDAASLGYFGLFKEKMSLYCGKGHDLYQVQGEVSAEDLESCPFACMGFNSPNQVVCNNLEIKQSATAYNQEGVAMLIQSGKFLGFLPEHYAEPFVQSGEFSQIFHEDYEYECDYAAIYALALQPERPAEAFLKALKDCHELEVADVS